MLLPFYKYQGNGNDFVLFDGIALGLQDADFSVQWVESLCNRRFGVGADGFILVLNRNGVFEIVYRNADGKPSSLCGNGSRCFIDFICTYKSAPLTGQFLAVDGLHQYRWQSHTQVAIEMFAREAAHPLAQHTYEVFTGSPHYIQFSEHIDEILNFVTEAQAIRYAEQYADNGININFVEVLQPFHLKMRTYERGVEDETLACGTGMTAAAIAQLVELQPTEIQPIRVDMPGGSCMFQFDGYRWQNNSPIWDTLWMIGPSQEVFTGHVPFTPIL